jgi:uncharacterized protein
MLRTYAIIGSAFLILSTSADGASFDCKTHRKPDEVAICSDSTLSSLDRELAAIYERLRASLTPELAATLRETQRSWLQSRRLCGSDQGCLTAIYRDRIAVLNTQSSSQQAGTATVAGLEVGDVSAEDAELAAQIIESNFKCAIPNTIGEAAAGGQKIQRANKLSINTRSFQLAVTQNETYVGRMVDARSLDASGRAPPGAPVSSSEYKSVGEFYAEYNELVGARHHAVPGELVSGGAAHYVRLSCRENRPCIRTCNQVDRGQRHCSTSSETDIQVCNKEAATDIRQDMAKLVAFNRRPRSR